MPFALLILAIADVTFFGLAASFRRIMPSLVSPLPMRETPIQASGDTLYAYRRKKCDHFIIGKYCLICCTFADFCDIAILGQESFMAIISAPQRSSDSFISSCTINMPSLYLEDRYASYLFLWPQEAFHIIGFPFESLITTGP